MKIKLILILVFLFSVNIGAQTNEQLAESKKLIDEITVSLRNKRYDEVITKSTRYLEISPKAGSMHLIRGMAYYSSGEIDKGVLDFTRSLDLGVTGEQKISAYQMRAISLYQSKRYTEAIRDFDILAVELSNDFRVFLYRGWCYFYLQKYETSIADFDRALKIGPNEPGIRRFRGAAFVKTGNYEKAVQDETAEMLLSPDDPQPYKIRAEAYRKLGKNDLADADERIYVKMGGKPEGSAKTATPQNSGDRLNFLLDRAQKEFTNEEWDASIKSYNEIIEILGEDFEEIYAIYFSRGRSFYEKGDLDSAMVDYNRVIARKPNLAAAYTFRGEVYLQKKQYQSAEQDFKKALQLDSKDLLAYRRRAELFYDTKQYDKAIADSTSVIALDPKYQTGWYFRAVSYFEKGEYQSAINDFSEYIKLVPENAEGYVQRAKAFRKLGKIGEAEADERKAAELKKK